MIYEWEIMHIWDTKKTQNKISETFTQQKRKIDEINEICR